MIYYATFILGELPHFAIGDEDSVMPIYCQRAGQTVYAKLAVKFPAILKFVEGSSFSEVREGKGNSVEEIVGQLGIELSEEIVEPT